MIWTWQLISDQTNKNRIIIISLSLSPFLLSHSYFDPAVLQFCNAGYFLILLQSYWAHDEIIIRSWCVSFLPVKAMAELFQCQLKIKSCFITTNYLLSGKVFISLSLLCQTCNNTWECLMLRQDDTMHCPALQSVLVKCTGNGYDRTNSPPVVTCNKTNRHPALTPVNIHHPTWTMQSSSW